MAGKLTPKQRRFVQEYLIDLNATAAARRSGYSEKTADRIGPELLGKPCVLAEIQAAIELRERRTAITQDRVLAELAAVAFANGTDFAQIQGNGHVLFTPTDQLTAEKKRAVASIKEGQFGTEVKTYDKIKALELLGKHLGMFGDRAGAATQEVNNLLDAIKGIEVNTDEVQEAE